MKSSAINTDNIVNTKIVFTSDIHGNFFPFDYINMKDAPGSYARVATAVDSIRNSVGTENVLLLDNGDILQGQPTVYYYNFIDTSSTHIAAEIYNYLNVNAATIGNHDIETGHDVYNRWRNQTKTLILAANAIDIHTNKPYFQPYEIFNCGGLLIAILGLITPAIPAWLPENLWCGIRFEPMEDSATKWMQMIQETESPDIIIGLFHSGRDASKTTAGFSENASLTTAININGFDAILMGHDHLPICSTVKNKFGNTVHLLNPGNNAIKIGVISLSGKKDDINIHSELIDISDITPNAEFMQHFSKHRENVMKFVTEEIAEITDSIYSCESFFGPSEFMTLLHELQLQISGADISMAAPLTFNGIISVGTMTVSDMFTLYKYENMLSTLRLSGQEIKDYLEYSYSLWIQEIVEVGQKHLMKYISKNPSIDNNNLINPPYNFDSAAGINYTVDVRKPYGKKINITTLSSGETFDLNKTYTVAVNSYRAGGGGNHLIDGAGIPYDELKSRVISSTDKDLRYYLMKLLRDKKKVYPHTIYNWEFIPAEIVKPAIACDRKILFGK